MWEFHVACVQPKPQKEAPVAYNRGAHTARKFFDNRGIGLLKIWNSFLTEAQRFTGMLLCRYLFMNV